jgi:hypothetical protein
MRLWTLVSLHRARIGNFPGYPPVDLRPGPRTVANVNAATKLFVDIWNFHFVKPHQDPDTYHHITQRRITKLDAANVRTLIEWEKAIAPGIIKHIQAWKPYNPFPTLAARKSYICPDGTMRGEDIETLGGFYTRDSGSPTGIFIDVGFVSADGSTVTVIRHMGPMPIGSWERGPHENVETFYVPEFTLHIGMSLRVRFSNNATSWIAQTGAWSKASTFPAQTWKFTYTSAGNIINDMGQILLGQGQTRLEYQRTL